MEPKRTVWLTSVEISAAAVITIQCNHFPDSWIDHSLPVDVRVSDARHLEVEPVRWPGSIAPLNPSHVVVQCTVRIYLREERN